MESQCEHIETKMEQATLYEAHPSMFRSHPIVFILSVFSIAAYGMGLVIILIWWLICMRKTLTVTNERTTLRIGILSKQVNEIRHSDVRNIKLRQGLFQRILRSGSIAVGSSATGVYEIVVKGIPHPDKIKELVDKYRQQ